PGEVCNFGSMLRTVPPEGTLQTLKSSPRIQSRPQDMITAALIQRRQQPIMEMIAPSSNGFTPIQRIGPGPWILRPVEPIAGPDKVVGGGEIVGGIRNDAT